MDNWEEAVNSFDNLFCTKSASGFDQFMIRFHYGEKNLIISATDLNSSFWEQRLGLRDMKKMASTRRIRTKLFLLIH